MMVRETKEKCVLINVCKGEVKIFVLKCQGIKDIPELRLSDILVLFSFGLIY